MRRSAVLVLLAAVALPAAAAPAAPAATVAASGGTTTVRPGVALERAKVRLEATGDARRRSGRIVLPIAAGSVGRDGEATTLRHATRAGLRLRAPRGRVTISALRLDLDRTPTVVGRVGGGPRRTLFRVAPAAPLRIDAAAGTAGGALRLTATSATLRTLRRALRLPKLPGAKIARATVAATFAPTTGGPGPASTRIASGHADWGVKASFRRYLAGAFAGGTTTLADGAANNPDGSFRFAAGSGQHDPATGALDARFAGSVLFSGHGSGDAAMLRVEIRRPRIVVAAGAKQGMLHADVRSKSLSSGHVVDYPNVGLATLDLTKGSRTANGKTVGWSGVPATLTEAGAPAFADFYHPGEALDPITFSVVNG
ncbi:HtaA domain-containing protein [Patulibacter defluvii]|uniref:HtaA domain-containing protein n=1 Tax=Patulibacter defluvii TaxID=3095358 RepID=UPI002A753515|nr:HtaA domain-containing protein [Patulibacter sp. DM4]